MALDKKYTDAAKADLAKCTTEADYQDFKLIHPQFKNTSIQSLAREKRRLVADDKANSTEEAFYDFMGKGRLVKDVAKRFKLSEAEALKRIKKKREGYDLLVQKNEYGEDVYLWLPQIDKTFKPEKSPFKLHNFHEQGSVPWVVAEFPNSFDYESIDLLPLSDLHYGHKACLVDKIREYVDYIRRTPNVITFLNGDLIENSSKLSVASGVYEQEITPDEQIQHIITMLRPIAHKIMFSIPGNHEERAMRHMGIDVARIIAEGIGVPYFDEPVHFDIQWKGNRWLGHTMHGVSNSQTPGGRINAASKPIKFHDFHHIYISGHVHNSHNLEQTALVRDYHNMRVALKKYYMVILPSFMGYSGTYASRMGWEPPSSGTINFRMYPDGRYRIVV